MQQMGQARNACFLLWEDSLVDDGRAPSISQPASGQPLDGIHDPMTPAGKRQRQNQKRSVIVIGNEKGGSGKTATAKNLAVGLARKGFRVLLLGCDSRGPLASDLSVEVPDDLLPLADALKERRLQDAFVETPIPGLLLIPGDLSLDEQALAGEPMRDTILKRALEALKVPLDFIVIDTPPGINLVTMNAIMAADHLVIPCDADRESLEAACRTIEAALEYLQFRPEVNPDGFYRLLITMHDHRDRVINHWFAQQIRQLSLPVFRTKIHRSTSIKKARANGLSIFDYAKKQKRNGSAPGRGASDYASFTRELLSYVKR